MRSRAIAGLCVLAAGLLAAGCGDDACDPDDLRRRLAAAVPGDVVEAGACTMTGPFRVPAGVRLEGRGEGATVLIAPAEGAALELVPGEPRAEAASLSVYSGRGCAAVVARGPGGAALSSVDVQADVGIGVGADGGARLFLDDVTVLGPVTADIADSLVPPLPPFRCGAGTLATHGIVVVDAAVELLDVTTEGFGAFGALFVRSEARWIRGSADTNLGAGLEVWGGRATLQDVFLTGTRQGAGTIEAYNGVFGGGASVLSTGLSVSGSDVHGLMHDGVDDVIHDGLSVIGNDFAGVWVQGSGRVRIGEEGSSRINLIEGNGFGGLVVIDSTGVEIRSTRIEGTEERTALMGARTVRAGDGVQLVRSEALLRDITLVDNLRVGALVDLGGGSTSAIALEAVTVEASGTSLGAIAQNGTVAPGWDSGVTRLGATGGNDGMFSGTLPVGDAVGPPCFPPLSDVDRRGLDALITP